MKSRAKMVVVRAVFDQAETIVIAIEAKQEAYG
jgi:hypothetical protein